MPVTLGSNIASLRGQRQLAKPSHELGTVFQRLSSGQRINKASDDAAGLSIADSLSARGRIYNQGVRNLNDGQSLLAIADAAVENLTGIIIRLEELAEQAANGVYTNKQRKALDAEAQALSKEYFRISKTTEFNGQRLLAGDFDSVNLQGGVGVSAVLSAGVGGAIGTGSFDARVGYSVPGPFSVAPGDFNGDGNLDLVAASSANGSLHVLLGQGGGTFTPQVSYLVGSGPRSLAIADFNGDGVLDLASADGGSNSASVLLGLGNGTFAPRLSYTTDSATNSIASGDFNGDGILDLVTADSSNRISVFMGTGSGTFAPRATYAAGMAPRGVATGDFNGDSVLDLVTADYGSTASVLLGNSNGTFKAAVAYSAGSGTNSVSIGDFNGDGALDFVTADFTGNSVSVFMGIVGSGNGTFAPRVSYSVGSPHSVAIADFNGDSVLDLVTADTTTATTSVLLGAGNGTFAARVSYAAGTQPRTTSTGDFNGDGVLDLVTADLFSSEVGILLGRTKDGVGPLLPFSLKRLADARQALPVFSRKREQLAEQRGEIGAFQSRTAIAIDVLQVSSENFRAAESRIRDSDIADESSRLVRLNILQQAASSVLAQANQQPALALQLLG